MSRVTVIELGEDRDDQILVDLLSQTRSSPATLDRFQWLYRDNPDGAAIVWGLLDEDSDEIVGFTACLPRRVCVRGNSCMAWIGADFSIAPAYRTLGPAVKLRRAAKEAIDQGRADFLYAHPNERMAKIHARVGHRAVGQMQRFARPLKVSPHLPPVLRWCGPIADRIWSLCSRETWQIRRSRTLFRADATFDSRYDELAERLCQLRPLVGLRDQRYLNWRYRQNPLARYHVIEAQSARGLEGYILFEEESGCLQIKDLVALEPEVIDQLLGAISRYGRRQRVASLSFGILRGHPWESALLRWGFRPRSETSEMFAYAAQADLLEELVDSGNWVITVGDRDI